jgi:hypothetical protein
VVPRRFRRGTRQKTRPPKCITEQRRSADTELEDIMDFGSEAFELPSIWVPYSFRVRILTGVSQFLGPRAVIDTAAVRTERRAPARLGAAE